MKEVAEKQLWSFEIKLNKEETYCDPYIMDVNLAKKGIRGTIISKKSFEDIINKDQVDARC